MDQISGHASSLCSGLPAYMRALRIVC